MRDPRILSLSRGATGTATHDCDLAGLLHMDWEMGLEPEMAGKIDGGAPRGEGPQNGRKMARQMPGRHFLLNWPRFGHFGNPPFWAGGYFAGILRPFLVLGHLPIL